jgi:hypothetical protein
MVLKEQGMRQRILWIGLFVSLLLAALPSCKRDVVAPGDPVAAVEGLAEAIRDNDLQRYSRLSLPPNLHAQMEQRWNTEVSRAAPLNEAQRKDHERYIKQLTEPGAEEKLMARYEKKLKQFQGELNSQWPMMRSAAQIFVNGAIQANDTLTPAERAHAGELSKAIIAWLDPKLFSDKEKARAAIAILCRTAREADIKNPDAIRTMPLQTSLQKGGIGIKALKEIAQVYDVDVDAALSSMETQLIDGSENEATVEVRYRLLNKDIAFEMDLLRIDGRWYPADSVRDAREDLKQPLPNPAASAAP